MYKPVDPKVSFPGMEESVLAWWEKNNVFKRSIEQRKNAEEFVFFDGPPFATGLPHFGHFVPGTIKDVIPRYKTMKGLRVERRFGWDCHGLPVEYELEKMIGVSGKTAIEAYGVAKFNEECRGIVLRYTSQWRKTMSRAGRWVDFDNDYKTMDPSYMETIWWIFKQLWEKGYIYEGAYILPYSPKLATPLSNFEVNQGGYKDVHDPAITVRFKIVDDAAGKHVDGPDYKAGGAAYILAWTTTPWTLPSNLALGVGPDIDYLKILDGSDVYYIAEARASVYYKDGIEGWVAPAADGAAGTAAGGQGSTAGHGDAAGKGATGGGKDGAAVTASASSPRPKLLAKVKGAALAKYHYEPLFPYFKDLDKQGAYRVHTAEFVSTGDGTGIVHLAPGFGEDDNAALKGTGLPALCPIDPECRFTDEVPDYKGLFVKDADKAIIQRLKEEGKLVRRDTILHAYPHDYRTGVPLIYRAISSWFVNIDKVKDSMLKANSTINWIPGHLQTGRFGKWLENARDWAISRNRYWGNPIPVWKSDGSDHVECIGSIAELEQKSGKKVTDLHKHFVDDITWPSPDGKGTMRRVPEVLDCWFESGAMPYGQNHYPFENKERVEKYLPADFISEGLDQTRGWFYTLTVLAAGLFDRAAFKNVVTNGLVLAEDGRKMSKSLRNFTDPNAVMDNFGADALRLYLMNSGVTRAEDLKYSDEGVKDVLKTVLLPLWNAYSFFVTYANIDGFQPKGIAGSAGPANPLDRWILSLAETLVGSVGAALDSYDMEGACKPIVNFIDQLNNWYIRRSRRRFWKSENDSDKDQAYETLYEVLTRLVTVAAPVVPFITEEIWQNLRRPSDPESVHLCDYPAVIERRRDLELERRMEITQKAVSMGRAIRNLHNLKTRQPLRAMYVVTRNAEEKRVLLEMEDIVREELNVKEVIFRDNEEELVEYSAKANFKVLGQKLGKDMKTAADQIAAFKAREIQGLLEGGTLHIDVAGRGVDITAESVLVQRSEKQGLKVQNDGSLTIGLDPVVTEELKQEGLVRDLVRGIQSLRKEKEFDVSDRISVDIHVDDEIRKAVESFQDYFKGETLCEVLRFSNTVQETALDSGDVTGTVSLKKL